MAAIIGGTWTYSGDPSASTKDAVRHYIGDTNNQSQVFSDEEILFQIGEEGSARLAAAALAEMIAASGDLVDKKIGDLSISRSQQSAEMKALAKSLRGRAAMGGIGIFAGGISHANKDTYESDPDVNQPTFYRGQFDHPDTVQDGSGQPANGTT